MNDESLNLLSPRHGVTIAFEGIDGSGKTTLADAFSSQLSSSGVGHVRVGKRDTPEVERITTALSSREYHFAPSDGMAFTRWHASMSGSSSAGRLRWLCSIAVY